MNNSLPLKITIVQGAFFPVPPLRGGAVEKVWFMLGKKFAELGHEVTHISRSFKGLSDSEVIDGVQHFRISGFDPSPFFLISKILDLIYSWKAIRLIPHSDIIVTNSFWLPILLRRTKLGKVYVHIARFPKGQMRLYRLAARLQTVSQAVADGVITECPELKDKVRVVRNSLTEYISNLANQNFNNKQNEILFVGRIHREKGLHILIPAFAAFLKESRKNWKLIIVGPWETNAGGSGEVYLDELKELSKENKDCIKFVGATFDEKKLGEFYQRAKVFVYPSLAEKGEALPVAPIEALACSCPVVLSNLRCFDEYLKPGVNGLNFDYKSRDPVASLADALLEITSDEARLLSYAEEAYKTSRNFSPESVAREFLSDFKAVLGG